VFIKKALKFYAPSNFNLPGSSPVWWRIACTAAVERTGYVHVHGRKLKLQRMGTVHIDLQDMQPTATSMVAVLAYWLSFEHVRDPRSALEPAIAQTALLLGGYHVFNLLAPFT
jgi:hypothetical protein